MSKNILEKYKNIEILGTGQFGNVYKVKYNNEYQLDNYNENTKN